MRRNFELHIYIGYTIRFRESYRMKIYRIANNRTEIEDIIYGLENYAELEPNQNRIKALESVKNPDINIKTMLELWSKGHGVLSKPDRIKSLKKLLDYRFGYCLQQAFKALEEHPNWKLMKGPPAYNHSECTSHFWTVDEKGNVRDYASDVVPDDYAYVGREVDPDSVKEELKELGLI